MSTLLRSIPYFFTLCVSLYVVSFLGSDLNLTSIRRSQAFASTLLSSLPFLHGSSSPDLKTNHLPDTFSYSYANRTEQANASTSDVPVAHRTLGIASRIYVVSLPRRVDRRARLDALFNFMKIEKTWWDATSSQSFLVGVIMERVRWERAMHAIRVQWGHEHYPTKAAPQEEDLHAASLRYTTKAFKDAVELNEEDRVFWNDDAEANPDVYPPLLGKLQSGTSLPSLDLEDTSRRNTSKVLRMPLDGSELWTLDPLLDNRSTRLTNPIPPPPYPDLRLPIPCAPLHLAFDVPSTDALYTDEAAALMLYEGEGSVGGEGDKPVKATDSRLRSSFSREPCHELCDLEVEDMDEDGITQNLERRHPLAPPSPYPHHLTLSRGMVACWDSHLRLLRHIAGSPDESVIVLEDDVDLEFDLGHILNRLGGALPENWDIVFLGHCWSPHEDFFPPLPLPDIPDHLIVSNVTTFARLHPSFAPKCTHAYAVSRTGAARLVRHLRSTSTFLDQSASATHDPKVNTNDSHRSRTLRHRFTSRSKLARSARGLGFAYGRALDQAFVRLIQDRRISAFSIVPSVVVQTKESPSDITDGNGSSWKDTLRDSGLQRLRDEE